MYNSSRYAPRNKRGNRFQKQRSLRPAPQTVAVSQLVKKAVVQPLSAYTPTHQFADFQLDSQLLQAIVARGYTAPTPIQDQAITPLLSGRDVVGIANTGTGKTAAFLIPLIQKVIRDRSQKALIIAPTRELATQIEEELRAFTRGLHIFSALCIGGMGIHGQIRMLQRGPNFVIGTPGRLKDLEGQRKLFLGEYKSIVLDEVDRMLDMGFIHDVRHIVSRLSHPRQSLFFSATLPPTVKAIMQTFLTNPITITVKTGDTATNVDQDVIRTRGKEKIEVLHDLLLQEGFDKVLLFGRTKWGVEKLSRALMERGFKAAAIHGNKSQNQRQRAISQFKANQVQVLLATDIASRGLDIENVSHVINYDAPATYEDYIHRIGRTGRAGKKGTALTFLE